MRARPCLVWLALAVVMVASACSDPPQNPDGTTVADTTEDPGLDVNLGDLKVDTGGQPDTATPDTTEVACQQESDCAGKVTGLGACETAACVAGKCQAADKADGIDCDTDDACVEGPTTCQAGVCQGKVRDCDDLNPCTDDSCDIETGCVHKNNTVSCDDHDACTEGEACAAGKCGGGTNVCGGVESDCGNGKDDEGDGATDCDDNDCAQDAGCLAAPKEILCNDGKDDDTDGKTDCQDGDCAADAACAKPEKETACQDQKDDDGDGATDCLDNDCAAHVACANPKETLCADQLDDDKDGKTDCQDADCVADAACKPGKEADCANGKDDDIDGATDCADNDCGTALNCKGESDCANKVDDDKDGKTDCQDGDCSSAAACAAAVTETNCADTIDNDKDGKTDCQDGDCGNVPGCQAKPEVACADQKDDDTDGFTDCQDADCKADAACKTTCDVCKAGDKLAPACDPCATTICKEDPYCCSTAWDSICVGEVADLCNKQCVPATEKVCNDGKDDDGDSLLDCLDPDCKGNPACAAEKDCKNSKDDDGDGMTDCGDLDCKSDAACQNAVCVDDYTLACGDSDTYGNGESGSTQVIDSYACTDGNVSGATGPEYAYTFTATCTGETTVTVVKQGGGAGFLDLLILDGAKPCASASCVAHGQMVAGTATRTFATTKGQTFHLVVDGYAGFVGDYTIKATCACTPETETDCIDKIDNDKDGQTDCKDGDCAQQLACSPTAETDCGNAKDDDVDGDTDCDDADCAKAAACLPKPEADCGNAKDDDADGKTDCQDTDCATAPACAPICKPDYAIGCDATDSWSSSGTGATKAVNEYKCADGNMVNETGSEYVYNYVATCDGELTVTLTKNTTQAGYLDLFLLDGEKPCSGTACVAHALMSGSTATRTVPVKLGQKLSIAVDGYLGFQGAFTLKTACKCVAKETKCGNKIDDDKDGQTDCADADCAADALCAAPKTEVACADTIDNDKDGQTDCKDADCKDDVACLAPEANCADKVDNDKDGKTDCLDTDCGKDAACANALELLCADKLDDDKDGKTDCDDTDCAGKTGCICAEDYELACGDTDSYSNNGSGSTKAVSGYTCNGTSVGNETGSEYTYLHEATCDGNVTVTLTKTSSTAGYLDLFVLDGAKVCAGSSCLTHALMASSGTATVTFAGVKGKTYRIVVDGYAGYAGSYTIKTTCACAVANETNCGDKIDEDKDGKVDCQDSDCAPLPVCAGPANCKDDYELMCGGYDAYANDALGATNVVSSYQCVEGGAIPDETGPEYAYEFVAECNGTATVTLLKSDADEGYLDLFVLDGTKACGGATCQTMAYMDAAGIAEVDFPVQQGQRFHIVVDGYEGYVGNFEIEANCSCK